MLINQHQSHPHPKIIETNPIRNVILLMYNYYTDSYIMSKNNLPNFLYEIKADSTQIIYEKEKRCS